ncbi:hypothetical protein K443DRAFT_686083, partial [Laccaria amethystina LaAM-08-1]
ILHGQRGAIYTKSALGGVTDHFDDEGLSCDDQVAGEAQTSIPMSARGTPGKETICLKSEEVSFY